MRRASLALALIVAVGATQGAFGQARPATGTEVLQRMHDAYTGKWYRTLTFVQTTTTYRNGAPSVSTWYESLRYTDSLSAQLRIDIGDPAGGNGVLYTADSSWSIRSGQLAKVTGRGNEFLPMIEGVYMQPVTKTVQQIASSGFDLSRVTARTWETRPVWVVGASSAADTISPQFWVDAGRNVVVRMIVPSAPNTPPMDIRLDGYVPVGSAWLATKVMMSIGDTPRQTEEYAGWKANIDLPAGLFNPATWTTTPHWFRSPANPKF
jgi:hypothetical protein